MTLDCARRSPSSSSSIETRRCQSAVGAWHVVLADGVSLSSSRSNSRRKSLSTIFFRRTVLFEIVDLTNPSEKFFADSMTNDRNGKRFSPNGEITPITDTCATFANGVFLFFHFFFLVVVSFSAHFLPRENHLYDRRSVSGAPSAPVYVTIPKSTRSAAFLVVRCVNAMRTQGGRGGRHFSRRRAVSSRDRDVKLIPRTYG